MDSDNGGTKSSKFSAIDKNNMNCIGEYSNSPLGQVGVVSLLDIMKILHSMLIVSLL